MPDASFEVDGETVRGALHEPEGTARGNLVMVHGMLSSIPEFGDAPAALAADGWRVLAVDLRGHGASDGERGYVTRSRAVADLRAARAHLADEGHDEPTALLGHSLGSAWTVATLAEDPGYAAGVLASPLRSITDEVGSGEYLLYRVLKGVQGLKMGLGMGPLHVPYRVDYDDLFVDPAVAKEARDAGFLQRSVNFRSFDDYLAVETDRWAASVQVPVLVVTGTSDHVVQPANQRRVYDALGAESELLEVDAGHSFFSDRGWEKVVQGIDGFLGKHLPA